jgi:hypothetical protein
MLISKPYMERRAYATARKTRPEVDAVCASEHLSLDDYLKTIGDEKLVIDMLAGDLQRIIEYPALGFAVPLAYLYSFLRSARSELVSVCE